MVCAAQPVWAAPDLIVLNGDVRTVDQSTPKAQAFAVENGTFTAIGSNDEIKGLAFSSDGRRLFSGSNDKSIKIWDVDSGQPIQTIAAHSSGVTDIALSPDNQRLASSSHDRTVKIWDLDSGREPRTLTGHNDTVWRVRFLGGGARLVSAGWSAFGAPSPW